MRSCHSVQSSPLASHLIPKRSWSHHNCLQLYHSKWSLQTSSISWNQTLWESYWIRIYSLQRASGDTNVIKVWETTLMASPFPLSFSPCSSSFSPCYRGLAFLQLKHMPDSLLLQELYICHSVSTKSLFPRYLQGFPFISFSPSQVLSSWWATLWQPYLKLQTSLPTTYSLCVFRKLIFSIAFNIIWHTISLFIYDFSSPPKIHEILGSMSLLYPHYLKQWSTTC